MWYWVFLKCQISVLITFIKNKNLKTPHIYCVTLLKMMVIYSVGISGFSNVVEWG